MKKLLFILCCLPLLIGAGNFKSKEAKMLAQELQDVIDETVNSIVKLEQEAGAEIDEIYLALESNGKSSGRLGIVFDQKSLVVLSVTPHGLADRLGVMTGDTLLSIHQNKNQIFPTGSRTETEMQNGDQLVAKVKRRGEEISLNYNVEYSKNLPSWRFELGDSAPDPEKLALNKLENANHNKPQGCGRISTFARPPFSKYLSRVQVYQIDGDNVLNNHSTFKVDAGVREVFVGYIGANHRANIQRMRTSSRNEDNSNILKIEVEPNKIYHLAAKFYQKTTSETGRGHFWEPVVWKITDSNCND